MTAGKEWISIAEAGKLTGIEAFYIRRAMQERLVQYEGRPESACFRRHEVALWQAKAAELVDRLCASKEKHCFRKAAYAPKHRYILPFRGTWLTGGTHIKHCTRYAWDFAVVDSSDYGKCHPGMTETEMLALKMRRGGNHNPRDFLCHGLEIIAPADGVILNAPDPGTFTDDKVDDQGHIAIDHGGHEYSHLNHILGRSVRVKKGDRVRQGQVICLAGGKHGDGVNQPPHLHWDLRDHPHFLFAKGLPMLISKALVYKDGQFERRYAFHLRAGMLVANIAEAEAV